jgi:hypothetical protein
MEKKELKIGDLVQIDPDHDPIFGGHFMVVTEPKEWGAQGYCPTFPIKDGSPMVVTYKGMAYYRCRFENMELVGKAEWIKHNES